MVKICIECGREFQARKSHQVVCSADCRKRYRTEYDHAYWLKRKTGRPSPRRCIVCGKEFTPPTNHKNRRTCSPACRRQRKLKYDTEYVRRVKEFYGDQRACNNRMLDYLAYLEKTYGALPNGRLKRLILSWRVDDV